MAFGKAVKLKKKTGQDVVPPVSKRTAGQLIVPSGDLVEIDEDKVVDLFLTKGGINPVLQMIERTAKNFAFTTNTEDGRKAIASIAYKVARSKTLLEKIGKEAAAPWKKKMAAVDNERKYAVAFLDNLKHEVRAPLNEWEAVNNPKEEITEEKKDDNKMARIEAAIVKALVGKAGLDKDSAARVVQSIAQREIPNVEIKWGL